MARRGPLNKLKLIGIKGGQIEKKPISSWSFTHRRGCRERSSDFSLRSAELQWSSRVGPRLKVEVLVEGNAWTLKSGVFVGDMSGKFGRLWVSSFRVFEKLRLRSKR